MRTALILLALGFGFSAPAYAIINGLTTEIITATNGVEANKGPKYEYKWKSGKCKYEYKADHKGVKEKYKCK
jgi:hypothetical protein